MHPAIQFTITKPTTTKVKSTVMTYINFLSLKIYVTNLGEVRTDIFYKDTNTHDYLNYDSHHPEHVKINIPFVLAKTIIVFTSDCEKMEENLADLENWLRDCGYPMGIIRKGIHNARIQGPAPAPENKKTIPLITTFYSNLDCGNIMDVTKSLIKNSKNQQIQEAFKDVNFIHARRQPPNILRQITSACFVEKNRARNPGIITCTRSNCKICRVYLQKCTSFTTSNGTEWQIKCEITCRSKNVVYYQVCNFCNVEAYIGKTDDLKERTNNHISCTRHRAGTGVFDHHVHDCAKNQNIPFVEPYFKLFVFMALTDYNGLRGHERRLHLQGHDTINKPHS